MENIYYVYEWIRLDTNEPFYVGKGKNDRCYKLTRGNNCHFNNIVKTIPVAVNILHDNLDEKTAYDLECYYIWQYRDVIGYDMCNVSDGGEGSSSRIGKHRTNEEKNKISRSMSNYRKNMTENERIIRNKKISKAMKERTLSDKHKESLKEAMKGKNNGRAVSVICLTTKKIFFTMSEGADEYGIKNISNIFECCKGKRKSAGKHNGKPLKWKILVWKHNKKYRII